MTKLPRAPRSIEEILAQRQRQFLVHSFLYYQLNENLIDDPTYDFICKEMVSIMKDYPEVAVKSPYYELCIPCGAFSSFSGFYLREYPPKIISKALHLLYQSKKPNISETFAQFIARWGFVLEQRNK